MLPGAITILSRFFGSFAPSSHPLLLLDYDGTLAPFRVDRFKAIPWPGVRDLLNSIQKQNRTRMAIVTGRPAGEIPPLLGLDEPVEVWGLHGFERLRADGSRELEAIPATARQKLDKLHADLGRDSLGGIFEPKLNAAVMHWRGLPPDRAVVVERRTRALFEPLARSDGFCLLPFEAGIELRIGRDKGGAVEVILAECSDCVPAAYLGDDLTDECAFKAVKDRGIGILVRFAPRETAAELWLQPPDELMDFLEAWLRASGPLQSNSTV